VAGQFTGPGAHEVDARVRRAELLRPRQIVDRGAEILQALPGERAIHVDLRKLRAEAYDAVEVGSRALEIVLPQVNQAAIEVRPGRFRPQRDAGRVTGPRFLVLGQ